MKPTINDIHVDPVLSNISVGYRPAGFIADLVAPIIPVAKESGIYFVYDKSNLRLEDALRAPAAPHKRIGYNVSQETYQCHEYSLEKAIDDRVKSNAPVPLNMDRDATIFLTDKIMLQREKRVADLLTSTSNITNYTTLSGTMYWTDATNSLPYADIATACQSVFDNIGLEANTLVLGYDAYRALIRHSNVLDRIKYTQSGVITPDLLAASFGIDRVIVAKASYNTAVEGQSDSLSAIWSDYALVCYIAPTPSLWTPSLAYSMATKNKVIEKYREENISSDVIRCKEIVAEELVAGAAGYLIVDTCA